MPNVGISALPVSCSKRTLLYVKTTSSSEYKNSEAKRGIMIAALTNVGVKGGIAYLFGGKKFGRFVFGLFCVIIVVGLAVTFLM